MFDINNAEFNAKMTALVALEPGRQRDRLTSEVFAELTNSGVITRWAWQFARQNNHHTDIEDLEQVIGEKLFKFVQARTAETSVRIYDWLKVLHGTARNGVKSYLASGQVTAASGMSGRARRAAVIARTTNELTAKLQRVPTQDEVIEEANGWAMATHKNAGRQGLLVTPDDFTALPSAPVSLDDVNPGAHAVESRAEHRSEALLAVSQLREVAAVLFPNDKNLSSVVSAWVDSTAEGERPNQSVIQLRTGLGRTAVRGAMARLSTVLDRMRAEYAA